MIKRFLMLVVMVFSVQLSFATPPIPPIGYRWILNEQFSDEFNGNALDKNKWNDTFGASHLHMAETIAP